MHQTQKALDLSKLLQVRQGANSILVNRESTIMEFKESFNLGSREKYAKTMASFANNRGGYLVFGVKPSPHFLIGVNQQRFELTDPSKLSDFLNTYFSPEIQWVMGTIIIHNVMLGFIYTAESIIKPIICTANSGSELKEGQIYYRYNAQSTNIKHAELREIIDMALQRERQAWMKHLKVIGEAGPTNVGVLDTIKGKILGSNTTFLIDEKLVRELKFIREGNISSGEGTPTMQLVGEVRSVAGITKEKEIPVAIHSDDIISAFLAERQLNADDSKSYLEEVTFQSSPYLPIFYFLEKSGLSNTEAIDVFQRSKSIYKHVKTILIKRLEDNIHIQSTTSVNQPLPKVDFLKPEGFQEVYSTYKTHKEKRTFYLAVLKSNPRLIDRSLFEKDAKIISQATTHLKKKDLEKFLKDILELLLHGFTQYFSKMNSVEKLEFRKAISYIDQVMYSKVQKDT